MCCSRQAVVVEDLAKEFYFFRSGMARLFWAVFGFKGYTGSFSALKGVSFTVARGESLAIIGRNGSGKSTLLKILTGVATPTRGRVVVSGRVAALLELGLGFHPHLTGMENIQLNALFAGITPSQLRERIDFISEFSELGPFLQRPVGTYSTGMFMRLAFSLALAARPDILIVDEALSVGDQRFQKKCLDYISHLLDGGVTLIFCSHDMYSVERLCRRAIWLEGGEVRMEGPVHRVVVAYQESLKERRRREAVEFDAPPVVIEDIALESRESGDGGAVPPCSPLSLRIQFRSHSNRPLHLHFGIGIYTQDDVECFASSTAVDGLPPLEVNPGQEGSVALHIPRLQLLDGRYTVTAIVQDEKGLLVYHRLIRPDMLHVLQKRLRVRGLFYLDHRWEMGPAPPS